uniref:Stage II sporulation protein P n=1 Tax=Clostridioides difficile TaxID=1496 RepID=A0A381IDQ1_CLODI|nr:stage II sporulation protein P [Clostridioides difficile]
MFKKCIKVVTLTFILVCILPGKSLALNQDDFLKFLVNSSYPEAKVEGNDTENKKNNKIKKQVRKIRKKVKKKTLNLKMQVKLIIKKRVKKIYKTLCW